MKRTILLLPFLFLLAIVLSGNVSIHTERSALQNPPPVTGPGPFIFSAFDNRWDQSFTYINDILGFNVWHKYADNSIGENGRTIPTGWTSADTLFADINHYRSGVRDVIDDIAQNNMTALMMRPKVEWLCYGQRSDYQCEEVSLSDDLWFYSFNNHETGTDVTDNSAYGNGETVKYCEAGTDPAEYVARRLKANSEQSRRSSNGDFHADSKQTWLIKPRIRIDSSFADNPANWNTNVCKIKVIGADGSTILKEVDIKVTNFLDAGLNYNGKYLEEFNNLPITDSLRIFDDWGDNWTYHPRGTSASDGSSDNKADIQVYWYGNCDMWIDYVRVDNDVADELFKGNNDDWLEWEAEDIACYNGGASSYRFYIEWFEFNNIPCIEYVNKKLDSIAQSSCGKSITIMSLHTYYLYGAHVPWADRHTVVNAGHYKRNVIDRIGTSEIFIPSYPFTSQYNIHNPDEPKPYPSWSKIPNTLPTVRANQHGNGTLAYPLAPSAYDDWLQNWLDSVPNTFESGYNGPFKYTTMQDQGGFRYAMKLGDSLSKETGLPFIYNPQIHIWKLAYDPLVGSISEVQREPTVEETDMTANVALTYGARGLIYFRYHSWNTAIPDTFYERGIALHDGTPRYLNIYGQEKWNGLIAQSKRMKKWEPYIMSFNDNDRKSFIYRFSNERSEMASVTFIDSMNTYPPVEFAPDPIDPDLDQLPPDPANNTYLQTGFFKRDGESEHNKYFMVVNKRCAPYVDSANMTNIGGRRLVAFYPNEAHLPGFNNWKVINLEDSSTVWTFNKNSNSPVYLGDFMPGEGKLFKLAPVMQEGGTFVTNESVGLDVICKDTVL